MKIKEGLLLKEIAGKWVLVPTDDAAPDMDSIITLSSSAAMLWRELEKGVDSLEHLANALLREYEIDYRTALRDSEDFTTQLKNNGMLEY